ncbi:MAG: OmpA family protein, partial [Bacteroidota bacterium]
PDNTVPIVYKNYLDVYVVEKIYQEPGNPNSEVLGRRPLNGATLDIKLAKENRAVTIDEEGKVRLTLKDNSAYEFFASKEGYLNNDARFSSVGLGRDPNNPEQIYEVEIVLEQIFLDQEIVLENIYYDFDQSFIRNDAKPTLNELASVLRKNPEINIQLGSHTDCRGADGYNETLSRKRAQAAVDYLIENGIEAFRLAAVGYGENSPAADCLCSRCDEDQHQQNRRTTFKILN